MFFNNHSNHKYVWHINLFHIIILEVECNIFYFAYLAIFFHIKVHIFLYLYLKCNFHILPIPTIFNMNFQEIGKKIN